MVGLGDRQYSYRCKRIGRQTHKMMVVMMMMMMVMMTVVVVVILLLSTTDSLKQRTLAAVTGRQTRSWW